MSAVAVEGFLFDLDGVLTATADVHRRAWRDLFEAWLPRLGVSEPYHDTDYDRFIDGKPRADGVADLLASRGVALPWGEPRDTPGLRTVWGLANDKNERFTRLIGRDGVAVFPDAVALLDRLPATSRLAVVSSSRNARYVLEAAGLDGRFPVVVDGLVIDELGLPGKPAPDCFWEAARRLSLPPAACVVLEDAVAGVRAGRAGAFGLVVGVDRTGCGEALREAGADVVVTTFDDLWAAGKPA